MKPAEARWNQQLHQAAWGGTAAPDRCFRRLCAIQRTVGVVEQHTAVLSGCEASSGAVDQTGAEMLLQRRHLPRDGWLECAMRPLHRDAPPPLSAYGLILVVALPV